jgi:hypothetical protein
VAATTDSRLALKCASTKEALESLLTACASSSLDPTVTWSQRLLSVARSASTPMFSGVVLSVAASDNFDHHFMQFVKNVEAVRRQSASAAEMLEYMLCMI